MTSRITDDELDALLAQLDAIVGDAVEIEQVVDQPYQLLQLPLHRIERMRSPFGAPARALENFERVAQRSERIAELVRQRGEKFILAVVGFGKIRCQLSADCPRAAVAR